MSGAELRTSRGDNTAAAAVQHIIPDISSVDLDALWPDESESEAAHPQGTTWAHDWGAAAEWQMPAEGTRHPTAQHAAAERRWKREGDEVLCRRLNAELCAADGIDAMLEHVREHLASYNAVNVVTALHRISKVLFQALELPVPRGA